MVKRKSPTRKEVIEIMNEIQKDMRTPIEIALDIDKDGMTTARKLYAFLELANGQFSRWAKTNITENEFAEENVDYRGFDINVEGNITKDFKITAHFAKKLSCKGNGEKAEQAREYFTTLEERVKQKVIDLSQLSPELQMFNKIFQTVAQNELEQKRQAEQLNRIEEKQTVIEQKQEVIADTFQKTDDTEDFQEWAKNCICRIAESPKFDKGQGRSRNYSLAYGESYERLKQKRNCKLDDRVQKAKGRALIERPDIKKSELGKINKIYVIANDKDLRPAYELVIKDMMANYCMT